MTTFGTVELPKVAGLELAVQPPNGLSLKGTITIRDPAGALAGFIRTLHEQAQSEKLTEVRVDVTGLRFVNSSAIRLFVDWATWVKSAPAPCYKLCFVTARGVTWQKTSFPALVSMVGDVVAIEEGG